MPSNESSPQAPRPRYPEEYLRIVNMLRARLERYEWIYLGQQEATRLKRTPLTKERYAEFENWLRRLCEQQSWPIEKNLDTKELLDDIAHIVRTYDIVRRLAQGGSTSLKEKIFISDKMKRASESEAIEVLGRENVHGPEDVERLFGFYPMHVPPIPYSKEQLEKSLEIKEKTGIEEMLVLFVTDEDGSPMTGERLDTLIQTKYSELGLGNFLFGGGWYRSDRLFTAPFTYLGWKLITKECIPNSKGKPLNWKRGDPWDEKDTQEHAIEAYANLVGLPRHTFSRPKPFDMLYAVALHLVATTNLAGENTHGERLLTSGYHASSTIYQGNFVAVASGQGGDGAFVSLVGRNGGLQPTGACLWR